MGFFGRTETEPDNKPEADDVEGPELFDDFQMMESFDPSKPVIVVCANGETFVGRFEGKDHAYPVATYRPQQ